MEPQLSSMVEKAGLFRSLNTEAMITPLNMMKVSHEGAFCNSGA